MKNRLSLIAILVISLIYIQFRFSYTDIQNGKPLKVTTWDAFGYYMYLPGIFIYNDVTELKWVPKIESEYEVTGGQLYQANKVENGNFVFKYLGGVALIQTPFFLIGHAIALLTDYKADGFSPPYQYSIAFGAITYFILALFLLRHILLRYYEERIVVLTLLMLTLATNLIQYIAIDSAQSHAFIFPLYVLILYCTIKWHESPKIKWAASIGFIIGLATISRPTEAIMLFIPLLWETHTKTRRKLKWQLVKKHRKHIIITIIFGLIGILPQLIYWKFTSGSWIYDVGSKWFFLNPWFRVLFGFENGWFIYTPITLFFIAGFFFMRDKQFKRSVITFCLLNIWIIIAWSDYKYGATFSTRAMVQSYPIFALAFAAFIQWIIKTRARFFFLTIGLYLIVVNFFQIGQYNSNIIHYQGMNALYYSRIYLDPSPTPLDMSLLDTDEILSDESSYKKQILIRSIHSANANITPELPYKIAETRISSTAYQWLKFDLELKATPGHETAYIHAKITQGNEFKEKVFRVRTAICKSNQFNKYAFYLEIPKSENDTQLELLIRSGKTFKTVLKNYKITGFSQKAN